MDTTIEKKLSTTIINGLREAVADVEDLQVQLALGKAEARDLFEDIKKELRTQLNQLKMRVRQGKTNSDLLAVVNAIEHLQVQLALGEAETREIFEEQLKKIEHALQQMEIALKPAIDKNVAMMHIRIQKFKAKLKLLSFAYNLKKIELLYDLEKRKEDLERTLQTIGADLEQKKTSLKENWLNIKKNINDAFGKLVMHILPVD